MTTPATPTPAPRIRWEPDGKGGWTGHVGTLETWLCQIWRPASPGSSWRLSSDQLGVFGRFLDDDDPGKLKATAEHWLEEFVSSLGAVFPRPPRKPPREPKPRHTGFAPGVAELANTARAARAGTRDAAAARELLARYNLTPREISVATTRARHPEWTWAQIGASLGMTKDQAWGTFRRMRAECATAIPAAKEAGQ